MNQPSKGLEGKMTETSATSTGINKSDRQRKTTLASMKTPLVTSNGDSGSNFDYLKGKSFEIFTAEDYEKVEVSLYDNEIAYQLVKLILL